MLATALATAGPAWAQTLTTVPPSTSVDITACQPVTRTFRVCVPGAVPLTPIEVYLLADTTGSMGGALTAVQNAANSMVTSLLNSGCSVAVGEYKDFGSSFCFNHLLAPSTNLATIVTQINAWSAGGGGDTPEGQFFALNEIATNNTIGWTAGSRRIVIWFGDAPGHDPVCSSVSGSATVTEASLTTALVTAGISVYPISLSGGGGLDGAVGSGYGGSCPSAGTAGQATRIATATGGLYSVLANSNTLVATILANVLTASGQFDVSLVPSAAIAPFVRSITPASQHIVQPTDPNLMACADFTVEFEPNGDAGTFAGTMDALVGPNTVLASTPYSVIAAHCCTPPPTYMVGWWHDLTATNRINAVTDGAWFNASGTPLGSPLVSPGYVGTQGLRHAGSQYVEVPTHQQLELGTNASFSIDLWVHPGAAFPGLQPLVSKMSIHPAAFGNNGYAFYLNNGRMELALESNGVIYRYPSSTTIPANTWSHLAVTVERRLSQVALGTFYLNGTALSPDVFTPTRDNVRSGAPFAIGMFQPATHLPPGHVITPFVGDTDEVELFRRALTAAEVAALFQASHAGKCADQLAPTSPYDPLYGIRILQADDALAMVPLPWLVHIGPFPFGDLHVSTNGFCYGGNGGGPAPGNANGYSGTAATLINNFRNGPPRIAPYLKDLDLRGPAAGVYFNLASNPNRAVITWLNAVEFGRTTPMTIQCQILESGPILFYYSTGMTVGGGVGLAGITTGGGVADPGASDLSLGAMANGSTIYETFDTTTRPFDLGRTAVTFTPIGSDYEAVPELVETARHESIGTGCYTRPAAFHERFASGTLDLVGSGLTLIPTGSGYFVQPGVAGPYQPPTGAVGLALGDDAQATIPLPGALSYPGGSTTQLAVCSNGFVWLQPNASNDTSPTNAELIGQTARLAPLWCDLVPDGATNTANVFVATTGSQVVITWLDCVVFGTSTIVTVQLAIDTATGIVEYRHHNGVPTITAIVGFSAGNGSVDGGEQDLSAGGPFEITWPEAAPLHLGADAAPILGTTFQYTIEQIPASGPGISALLLAFDELPGIDLGFLGAPGCALYLGPSLWAHALALGAPTVGVPVPVPATPTLTGAQVFAQGATFVPGVNAYGALVSQALKTTLGQF